MAWRCSASNNAGLINNLFNNGLITSERVRRAMLDACQSLLPLLHPEARVLDVGSGSGYLTHVLANLVAPGGTVIGVDHIQGLVDLADGNMKKSAEGRALLTEGRVSFVKADGRLGYPQGGPYDAIHVGAAAVTLHEPLVNQLKSPGRMFIPVQDPHRPDHQFIWVIDKHPDGSVEKKKSFGVSYVPLTDAPSSSSSSSSSWW